MVNQFLSPATSDPEQSKVKPDAPFIFHDLLRSNDEIKANKGRNVPMWYKDRRPTKQDLSPLSPDSTKTSPDSPRTSPDKAIYSEHWQFAENLQSRLSTVWGDELYSPSPSKLNNFDMNDLPHMSHMRSFLLIVCSVSFFVAPLVYMPLGTVQAAYNQKCFLYTKIKLIFTIRALNESEHEYKLLTFDAVSTEWGSQTLCDFTTFVPVSVAIFSVIIGWSTFTIWPAMMSMGKGGILMLLYLSISIVSLVVTTISNLLLRDGYSATCLSLGDQQTAMGISCRHLNNRDVTLLELTDTQIANNVHRAMKVAEMGGWCLVGLAGTKVLISAYTFLLIWFHFHYAPYLLDDSDSFYSDLSSP